MNESGHTYHEGLMDTAELSTSMESLHQLNQEINTGFRATATLEDLVIGLESIKEASVTELLLAETAIRGAVNGLGLESHDLTQDLVKCQGTTISTEGVVEFIKKVWQAIWNSVKRLLALAINVVRTISKSLTMTLRSFDQLSNAIAALDKREAQIRDPHTFYGDSIELLIIDDTLPKNCADIQKEVATLERLWDVLAVQWVNKTYTTGQKFIEATTKAQATDVPKLLQLTNAMVVNLHQTLPTLISRKPSPGNALFIGRGTGEVLPGNVNITVSVEQQKLSGELGLADAAQSLKVNLVEKSTKLNVNSLKNSATFDTPSLEALSTLLASARKLLVRMDTHFSGNRNRQLERWVEDMGGAMDRLSGEYEMYNQAGANGATRDEMNALMQYVPAFNRWVMDGQLEYSLHAARVCRAVGRLVKRSLDNYQS